MTRFIMLCGLAATLLLFTSRHLRLEVSPDQVARLGNDLTPMGTEKTGNSALGIPNWNGGLAKKAAPVSKDFLGDPFAQEKTLFIIDSKNAEQHKALLSAGHLALLAATAVTYHIPVYATHRTAAEFRELKLSQPCTTLF